MAIERIVCTVAVGDVERKDGDELSLAVEEQRARLTVDLRASERGADHDHLAAEAEQKSGDVVAAVDRPAPGRAFAAAVAVDDDVVGQQPDEAVGVAVLDCVEEAVGEALPLLARGLEPRPPIVHVVPRAHRELPGVVLALAHDVGDLVVSVAEDVVEQEDRPLDRSEALQEHEERE